MPVQALFVALGTRMAERFPVAYHKLCCRLMGIDIATVGAMSRNRPASRRLSLSYSAADAGAGAVRGARHAHGRAIPGRLSQALLPPDGDRHRDRGGDVAQ